MGTTFLVFFGILLFFSLVVVHEFGHFIAAKRGGVEVQEFGIGFPPRLVKFKTKNKWIFSINALPLGGFVKLKGEHDMDNDPGSLGAANVWTKTKVMSAGVVMNLLAAYVILLVLGLIGMPQVIDNQFSISSDTHYLQHGQKYIGAQEVEPGSPASIAGIVKDDEIISVGAPGQVKALTSVHDLPNLTRARAGLSFEIDYLHGTSGSVIKRTVILRDAGTVANAASHGKQIGYLGLGVYQAQKGITIIRYTWSSPIIAAMLIKQFTIMTVGGLGKAVAGVGSIIAGSVSGNSRARLAGQSAASSQVAGPVGIFFIFKYGSTLGFRFILFIVAVLSLTLAIMNILPIPALDGGRLWLMLITRAFNKPLSPKREEAINAIGFAFLMVLVILVTVVDVKRFI